MHVPMVVVQFLAAEAGAVFAHGFEIGLPDCVRGGGKARRKPLEVSARTCLAYRCAVAPDEHLELPAAAPALEFVDRHARSRRMVSPQGDRVNRLRGGSEGVSNPIRRTLAPRSNVSALAVAARAAVPRGLSAANTCSACRRLSSHRDSDVDLAILLDRRQWPIRAEGRSVRRWPEDTAQQEARVADPGLVSIGADLPWTTRRETS